MCISIRCICSSYNFKPVKFVKEKYGFTYIFISHDLSVVKYMSDRIVVLFEGEIIEYQEADKMFLKPTNDYTRKLIKASL